MEHRYNEPRKLGDILKDMGVDSQNLEQKMKIQDACQRFAQRIMRGIQSYGFVIDSMDTFYKNASVLIMNMEEYYLQEKATMNHLIAVTHA
jgi:hypothetical protein